MQLQIRPARFIVSSRYRAPLRCFAQHCKVDFKVPLHLDFGRQLTVAGDCAPLGSWDPSSAAVLTWTEGDLWQGSVEIPAGYVIILLINLFCFYKTLISQIRIVDPILL